MERFGQMTDDELIAATRDDADAFGAFYERHGEAVLAFLANQTRDPEAALDLTAEVFAAALAASRRYRAGEAPARSWLFGIARHKLADRQRSRARETAARRRLGMPRRSFADEELERVEELIDAEQERYLSGLADLPPSERDAVRARVIDERDYVDISLATGSSQAAIRQRVSRGLARLARIKERRT